MQPVSPTESPSKQQISLPCRVWITALILTGLALIAPAPSHASNLFEKDELITSNYNPTCGEVTVVTDLDKDGYNDIITGCPGYNEYEPDGGAVAIYKGRSTDARFSGATMLSKKQRAATTNTAVRQSQLVILLAPVAITTSPWAAPPNILQLKIHLEAYWYLRAMQEEPTVVTSS